MGGRAFFDYTWKRKKKDLPQSSQRKSTEITEKKASDPDPEGTIYLAPTRGLGEVEFAGG
jgi:hypothetical protein